MSIINQDFDGYFTMVSNFQVGSEVLNIKIHTNKIRRTQNWVDEYPNFDPSRPYFETIYVDARPYLIVFDGESMKISSSTVDRDARTIPTKYPNHSRDWEVGRSQAYIYPDYKKAHIWECFLYDFFEPKIGEKQIAFWKAFEKLLRETAEIDEFFTQRHDPAFKSDAYGKFLSELNYQVAEQKGFMVKKIHH